MPFPDGFVIFEPENVPSQLRFPCCHTGLGLECEHWLLRSDGTMSLSPNGETLSHRWWQQADAREPLAGPAPNLPREDSTSTVLCAPAVPRLQPGSCYTRSCASSHQQQARANTDRAGDRLVFGQVTMVCRKVMAGEEAWSKTRLQDSRDERQVTQGNAQLPSVLSCVSGGRADGASGL